METEFTTDTPTGPLTCTLVTPPESERAPEPALLLTFSSTRQASLREPPYDIPARLFAARGHFVVSFDLPNHGSRVNQFGNGIDGMCAALLAGQDPFAQFVADGQAVIDACLARGLGVNGKIVACGVSRSAYCALRLAAADRRIHAVAGLAPVIDWRRLREFGAVQTVPAVVDLVLDRWATDLAGRPVFLTIGNHDQRVGTDCAVRFALRLLEIEQAQANGSVLHLHVIPEEGHALGEAWREAGARFLLHQVSMNRSNQ